MSGEGESLICGAGKKAYDWGMLAVPVKAIKELMYCREGYTEATKVPHAGTVQGYEYAQSA